MKYLVVVFFFLLSTNLYAQTVESHFKTLYQHSAKNGFDAKLEIKYTIDSLMGEPVVKASARYTVGPRVAVDGVNYQENYIPGEVLSKVKIVDLVLSIPFPSSQAAKSEVGLARNEPLIAVDFGAMSYPGEKWSFNTPGSPDWDHWIFWKEFDQRKYFSKQDAIKLFKGIEKQSPSVWSYVSVEKITFDMSAVRDWLKKKTLYPLSIKPEPSDATVQVVNIKPAYYNGIGLNEGRYQIRVKKEGYIQQTMWINLSAKQTEFPIVLKKAAKKSAKTKATKEDDFLESVEEDQERSQSKEKSKNSNKKFAGKSPLEKIAGYGLQARLSPLTEQYNVELKACNNGEPHKPAVKFGCSYNEPIAFHITFGCTSNCVEVSKAEAARNKERARKEKAENRRIICAQQERSWEKSVAEYPSALSNWKSKRESCLLKAKQQYDESIDSLIEDAESVNALMEDFD